MIPSISLPYFLCQLSDLKFFYKPKSRVTFVFLIHMKHQDCTTMMIESWIEIKVILNVLLKFLYETNVLLNS